MSAGVVAAIRRDDVAGLNTMRLANRLGGKKLAPGDYRLSVTARSSSGKTSNELSSTFIVVP